MGNTLPIGGINPDYELRLSSDEETPPPESSVIGRRNDSRGPPGNNTQSGLQRSQDGSLINRHGYPRQQLYDQIRSNTSNTTSHGPNRRAMPWTLREIDRFDETEFRKLYIAKLELFSDKWLNIAQPTILTPHHLFNAVVLDALWEYCKAHHIDADHPAIDRLWDKVVTSLKKDDGPRGPNGEALIFFGTSETHKIGKTLQLLSEGFDSNPILSNFKITDRSRLFIDHDRVTEIEKLGFDPDTNPFTAFLFDDNHDAGYAFNMATAWLAAMNRPDEPISLKQLIRCHAECTGSKTTNAEEAFNAQLGQFGLRWDEILTKEGNRELMQFHDQTTNLVNNSFNDAIKFEYLKGPTGFNGMLQRRMAATPVLVSLVECWIGQFQEVLKKIGTEQDAHAISLRAYTAIHLCQNLERLHVFGDGNGRVCDQVEFRRLFRQFGLKMPLLDNPGKVDGNSRQQVYKSAREGQERADKLQTTPDALSMLPLLDDPELEKLEKEFQELWTSTLDEVLPDIAARHIEQKQQ